MKSDFEQLIESIEAEAIAEGPEGVADLNSLRARFTVASEILVARKAAGMSQQRLAEASGIGQPEISKIENGESNLTIGTLGQLTAPLDLDIHLVPRHPGSTAVA